MSIYITGGTPATGKSTFGFDILPEEDKERIRTEWAAMTETERAAAVIVVAAPDTEDPQ